jgi:hypothetical protein
MIPYVFFEGEQERVLDAVALAMMQAPTDVDRIISTINSVSELARYGIRADHLLNDELAKAKARHPT